MEAVDVAFSAAPFEASTLVLSGTHGLRRGLYAVVPTGTSGC